MSSGEHPTAAGALPRLAAKLPDFALEHVPLVDSTNAELLRRARAGDARPTLLVADRQAAGRGRLGRAWQGEPGQALLFSLGLPLAPATWAGLSLVVGVAAAGALHPRVGLKWPNDLWWQDRKLGGILVETTAPAADAPGRHAVIGIGLNLAAPAAGDGELRTPAAGLRELDPALDAATVLERVAPAVVRAARDFALTGFAPWQARHAERDVLAGRTVVTSDGRHGIACGVAGDGALLLRTEGGATIALRSDEVSVRPAPA